MAFDRIRDILACMEDRHISLSDRHQAFVDEQVAAGEYANADDYVAALIDAEAKSREKLEALLLEALRDDGEDEWGPELMDEIRKEARRGAS